MLARHGDGVSDHDGPGVSLDEAEGVQSRGREAARISPSPSREEDWPDLAWQEGPAGTTAGALRQHRQHAAQAAREAPEPAGRTVQTAQV